MRILYTCLFPILFAACNGPAADKTSNVADSSGSGVHGHAPATTGGFSSEPMVLAGCYEMTIKRDTATMALQVQDTMVSGSLRYDWYEKDGNVGTIKGVLRDSLIIADYTFQSEGLTSVREVIFKIENNTLLPGFGELVDRNGKIMFQNKEELQYMSNTPFIKVDCPENK